MEARKPMFPNKNDPRRPGSKDGSSFQSSDDIETVYPVPSFTNKIEKTFKESFINIFIFERSFIKKLTTNVDIIYNKAWQFCCELAFHDI